MDLPDSLKAMMEAGLRRRSQVPTTPATRSTSPGSQHSDDSPIPIDPQLLPSSSSMDVNGFVVGPGTDASPTQRAVAQEPRKTNGGKQPRLSYQIHSFREDDEEEVDSDNDIESIEHEDTDMAEPTTTITGQSDSVTRLAQQMAKRFDFDEALTEDVVSYAKLRAIEQNVRLYCLVADVWRKAKDAKDSWMPSEQALDNIREICKAVLLSPSLPCYVGHILVVIVLAIINQREIGLPVGYQAIPSKVVKSTMLPAGEANIENLTNALYRKSAMGIQPSKESWGRVAVMRSVLNQGVRANKYWESISAVHQRARSKAEEMYPLRGQTNERAMAVSDQIRAIVEDDYAKYGNPMSNINAREPPSRRALIAEPFQDLVDDIVVLPQSELHGLAKEATGKAPPSAARKRLRKN